MKTILLLEDLPEIRAWLRLLLLQVFPSAQISEAARVSDAMSLIQAIQFDLAMVDLGLPDGSGRDVVEKLRELQPEAQSVVVTIQVPSRNASDVHPRLVRVTSRRPSPSPNATSVRAPGRSGPPTRSIAGVDGVGHWTRNATTRGGSAAPWYSAAAAMHGSTTPRHGKVVHAGAIWLAARDASSHPSVGATLMLIGIRLTSSDHAPRITSSAGPAGRWAPGSSSSGSCVRPVTSNTPSASATGATAN